MKNLIKNYITTLETLGFSLEKKNPPLHYARQKGNPLNISTIDNKKIIGILENTGIAIDPKNDKHRDKYFQGVRPIKFMESLLEKSVPYKQDIFRVVADKFQKDFYKDLKLSVKIYEADKIPTIYNMCDTHKNDNGKRTFLGRGVSCMQNRPKSWFYVYKYAKGLRIATLEDEEGNIYARALIWQNSENKKDFYLDRIYVAGALSPDDDIKATYQLQLYKGVLEAINQPFVNCYSISHIRKFLSDESALSKPSSNFKAVLVDDKTALDFDEFPYADTFQGLCGQTFYLDADNCEVGLTSTDGGNANDDRCTCDNCGTRVDEDYILYSESDGCHYCDECATYSEYEDDAILNDYIVEHRHTGDLMHSDNLTNH